MCVCISSSSSSSRRDEPSGLQFISGGPCHESPREQRWRGLQGPQRGLTASGAPSACAEPLSLWRGDVSSRHLPPLLCCLAKPLHAPLRRDSSSEGGRGGRQALNFPSPGLMGFLKCLVKTCAGMLFRLVESFIQSPTSLTKDS